MSFPAAVPPAVSRLRGNAGLPEAAARGVRGGVPVESERLYYYGGVGCGAGVAGVGLRRAARVVPEGLRGGGAVVGEAVGARGGGAGGGGNLGEEFLFVFLEGKRGRDWKIIPIFESIKNYS